MGSARMRLLGLGAAGALSLLVVGTARTAPAPAARRAPAQPSPSATAGHVPAAIDTVGTAGEDIYDLVKAGSWSKASTRLSALGSAAAKLPPTVGAAQKRRLGTAVAALGKAITSRNRRTAMVESNRITMIAAEMSGPYHPRVPVQVSMLDYYGRELEIWSEAKDTAKLKGAATGLAETWRSLRPEVEAHGGAAVAKRFGALVDRLSKATTPAQYGRLATPILDEVDNLEKVFQR